MNLKHDTLRTTLAVQSSRVLAARLLLILLVVAGPWAAPRAYAATITVNSTSLTVAFDGQCTLIEAMENARNANGGFNDCTAGSAASNVIELQVGQTYTFTGARTGAGTAGAIALPFVTRTLTINGHGSILTRGASSGSYRVLYVVSGATLTINDLTIQNIILPDTADGAVYNDNSTLIINHSTVKGTRVVGGGSGGGAITSRGCSAGGCTGTPTASLLVADSAVEDNESRSASSAFGAGAGINTYAVGSGAVNTATILRSRFHANTATNQGAGVSNAAYDSGATSTTAITQSSITANTTTGGATPAFGGGVTNFVGRVFTGSAANTVASLTITNTSIVSNTAANNGGSGFGGGIFNEVDCGFQVSCGGGAAAHLSLNSVTIAANVSGRDGGGDTQGAGIWSNNNDPTGSVDLTVRDSVITGNLANGTLGNCKLLNTGLTSNGFNIASDSGCGAPFHLFSDAQINLAPLNFSSFTYYRAPQTGSAAIDRTDCNVSTDQLGTARPLGASCDVGAIESNAAAAPATRPNSDFNGDGRSDPGIFRPSVTPNALWYSTPSGGGAAFQIFFGTSGDIPVPADYDGDGKADAVIWRPSSGLWYGPRNGAGTIVIQLALGQNGDIPVPCDYDGDGAIDPAIYRPSTGLWFGTRANGSTLVLNTNLGLVTGDIPVPADFNGDGRCDPAIMRPGVGPGGTNLWYSVPSGGGAAFQIFFGAVGDIPAPGDYDGDGKADAVIFRRTSGLWYGPRTGAGSIVIQLTLGQNGDIPVPGDYDGNGATDPAIYRPSSGLFFGTNAAGNVVVLNTNLGVATGDIPTPQRPHYQAAYPFFTSMRNDRGNDTAADTAPRASSGADVQSSSRAAPTPSARVDYVALGSDRGSLVIVLDARTRAEVTRFQAFGGSANGVHVVVGDVNGDRVADLIAAASTGGGSAVEVFDGQTFDLLYRFLAFAGVSGEVSVAAGDVTGDGRSDVVVGAAANGYVKVFDGASGALVRNFRAFAGISGGVSVAAGDVNGDGHADIVVGGAANGHVRAFDGVTSALIYNFLADDGVAGAVNVAAGDVTGDGFADIIAGSAAGATRVQVFDGRSGELRSSFLAFPGAPYGVRVGSADTNGDGIDDIIATPAGALPQVTIFDGASGGVLDSFFGLDPNGGAGVFAAGRGGSYTVRPR